LSITIEGLCFSYDERRILDDVDLCIQEGLTHLVLGQTGCGKTTLALLLVGLLKPEKGSILINGEDPAHADFDRRDVQLAFQFPETQIFEASVESEISYGLFNFGFSRQQALARSTWALDCVGLPQSLLARDPHKLSFGERRKVALASVIALKPSYLILDEPLAGLDWHGRRNLVKTVGRLKQEGMTTIVLTHEADLVGEIGDRISTVAGNAVSEPLSVEEFLYGDHVVDKTLVPGFARLISALKSKGLAIHGRPGCVESATETLIASLGIKDRRKI
jgi:energy-coupling factor transport system ATP-binding protein